MKALMYSKEKSGEVNEERCEKSFKIESLLIQVQKTRSRSEAKICRTIT